MKKFTMFAAVALLMAGMMVSCNSKEPVAPTTIGGVIKRDIKSIPDMLMGKTEADAKMALVNAGFVEMKGEVLAPARAKKVAPRKGGADGDDVSYVRTVLDGFLEVAEFECEDNVVAGVIVMFGKDSSAVELSTARDAAQQAFMTAYNPKECPNFIGNFMTREVEMSFVEGKHAESIKEQIAEFEAMLKSGDITKEEFDTYMRELSIFNLTGCAGLVAMMKTATNSNFHMDGMFTDNQAYEIVFNEGEGQNGLLKMLLLEYAVEGETCFAIQYGIQKNHIDRY